MADALKSAPVPQWELKSTTKSICKCSLFKAVEEKKPGDGCPSTVQLGALAARPGAALVAVLVGTSSETSSGWIAGMHFAWVIFSPSHSKKPAESRKSPSKVLRQSLSPGQAAEEGAEEEWDLPWEKGCLLWVGFCPAF